MLTSFPFNRLRPRPLLNAMRGRQILPKSPRACYCLYTAAGLARRYTGSSGSSPEGGLRRLYLVIAASRPCVKIISTAMTDRKSTRLNSSHVSISYAVFCLKKKKNLRVLERSALHGNGAQLQQSQRTFRRLPH